MIEAQVWILDEDVNMDESFFVDGLKTLPRQGELLVHNDTQYVVQTVAHEVDTNVDDSVREQDVTLWVLPYEIHERKLQALRGMG